MDIILKEDVQNLGRALEVVKVKNGYAHNFLFPRGLAVLATDSAKKMLENERLKLEEKSRQEKAEQQKIADKMKDVSLTIAAKVHEGEKLYGSISASDIAAKLKEVGYDIDKRNVLLAEPIKQLGMFSIKVQLHREVEAKVKLWIISDESR
ncbi:MAG TPA: 50S ribosomal protein L9 [Fibrobacteria bacterium]|nr:50S ribosomal protein L9 [Fibrobacteria bacterium]